MAACFDGENARATHVDGMLTIAVPKRLMPEPKRIKSYGTYPRGILEAESS